MTTIEDYAKNNNYKKYKKVAVLSPFLAVLGILI